MKRHNFDHCDADKQLPNYIVRKCTTHMAVSGICVVCMCVVFLHPVCVEHVLHPRLAAHVFFVVVFGINLVYVHGTICTISDLPESLAQHGGVCA